MLFRQIVVRAFHAQFFQLVQCNAAVYHTVYQPHDFGSADWFVRPESAVWIALRPACTRSGIDIAVRPMTGRNILKDVAALVVQSGKARGHDCKLGAGNRCVRLESVFIRTVYNANIIQRFHFLVEPAAGFYVVKRIV